MNRTAQRPFHSFFRWGRQIEPIFTAWQALPVSERQQIHVILRDVHELADERGLAALAEEILDR